jgi:hypothetical protein
MRKIVGAVIVAAIALVSGWNISLSKSEVTLSDMALSNVEALAQESSTDHCNRLCDNWPFTYCVLESSTSYTICMEKYPK